MKSIFLSLLLFISPIVSGAQQATIVSTGSTNIPGKSVEIGADGSAVVAHRSGEKQKMAIPKELCDRLLRDLKAAEPLDALPVSHCMKSASFGTSTYIMFNSVRSPDLSCPGQGDKRAAALQADAEELLRLADKK